MPIIRPSLPSLEDIFAMMQTGWETGIVTVGPVVLGEGKLLFDRPLPGGPMQLTGTRTFQNGMVELRYAIRN